MPVSSQYAWELKLCGWSYRAPWVSSRKNDDQSTIWLVFQSLAMRISAMRGPSVPVSVWASLLAIQMFIASDQFDRYRLVTDTLVGCVAASAPAPNSDATSVKTA